MKDLCVWLRTENEDVEGDVDGQSVPITPVAQVFKRESQSSDGRDASASAIQSDLLRLLESSHSHREFDELLATCYVPMETWYTRTIVDKVFVPICPYHKLTFFIGSPAIHP